MRRFMILLGLAASAACASSGSSPGSGIATPSERIVATDHDVVIRTSVPPNARVTIPVHPGRALEALKVVYDQLGVPPSIYEPVTGRVGNTNFWKSRKLGDTALSSYLNCGDSLAGTIADIYRIYISLISEVRPDGKGGSQVETAFTASARNMEGTSGDRIPCGTTGRLEDLIAKLVVQKAGAPPQ